MIIRVCYCMIKEEIKKNYNNNNENKWMNVSTGTRISTYVSQSVESFLSYE